MVEALIVNQFRCFKQVQLLGLGRVNVLVGDSGSGKTALLEAIYMAAHTQAQVALSFRRWRGLGALAGVGFSRQLFESLWSDLFHNFDSEHDITVTLRGSSPDHNRSVRVYYKEQQVITLPLEREGSPTSIALRPIVFEWTDASGQKGTSEVSLGAGGLAISQSGQPPIPGAFFNSFSIFDSPVEPAQMFSLLSQRKQETEIVEALKSVYPAIQGVSLELFGGVPSLAVAIDTLPARVPITLVSSGATKLAHILFTMANQRRGVILIDEIENGFYFKALPRIWQLLYEFAKRFDVQIFASTHSAEALQGLAPAVAGNESDFRLLRFSIGPRREPRIKMVPGGDLKAAIAEDVEVR